MTAINVSLTQDEIELLERALDSHSRAGDAAFRELNLLAMSIPDPGKRDDRVREVDEITRRQSKRLRFLKGKLVQAKIRFRVEEVAKSL